MSAQDKAKQLVEKYKRSMCKDDTYLAKRYAIVAVDEILEVVSSDESAIIVELQYWQAIKTEIEKI
jgi:hypothetical protein